jgi:hypothetical protein
MSVHSAKAVAISAFATLTFMTKGSGLLSTVDVNPTALYPVTIYEVYGIVPASFAGRL